MVGHGGTADHAWNQVCLDGEWHCVDVTQDDPTAYGTVSEQTAMRADKNKKGTKNPLVGTWKKISDPSSYDKLLNFLNYFTLLF